MKLEKMVVKAKAFRESVNAPEGGIVIFWDGKAEAWKNEVRDPHHNRPGCIAIDESGNRWESVGGGCSKGAKEWRLICD